MTGSRLEAFSDAVIAILMTIVVLQLKIPHGERLDELDGENSLAHAPTAAYGVVLLMAAIAIPRSFV